MNSVFPAKFDYCPSYGWPIIATILVGSNIYIKDTFQRRIQNPVKHLRRSVLQNSQRVIYFNYFDRVLNIPLPSTDLHWQKFVLKNPWKERCAKNVAFGVILVHIFPHSDWIRRDAEYLSVLSPNVEKWGPE